MGKIDTRKGFTLRTLRNEADKRGATVSGQVVGKSAEYNVDAPAGKVWAASSTHFLNVYWRTNEEGYRNESIADALSRMAYGLADCGDPQCDICQAAESENR